MQRARGMDELAAALDNMRAGHGHLGIWIEDSRGRQVYGGEPPVILERLAGNEVELHAPDGSRMRGLRVALDERLAPGAVLTVAVGVAPARGCCLRHRAAADLRSGSAPP